MQEEWQRHESRYLLAAVMEHLAASSFLQSHWDLNTVLEMVRVIPDVVSPYQRFQP